VAQVANATGWTWDYIEETLTVPRYKAMIEEWRITPPRGELLKMLAGYKYEAPKGIEEFMADFVGSDGSITVH
jgi:hypothetical protein